MLARGSARSSLAWERDTHDVSGMLRRWPQLEIPVLPTFASRWLIPRPGRFAAQHPHIVATLLPAAILPPPGGFDAAIHFEHSAWTGMEVTFLFASGRRWSAMLRPSDG